MVWMGAIGFIDDYLKKKKNKDGLSGIFKIIGQVGLGLIVGVTMYFSSRYYHQKKICRCSGS